MRLGLPSLAAVVLAGLVAAAPAVAQQHAGHEKLGQVNFANTCSPAVQADLTRAVALLHSFWWGATIKAFNEVAQKDPSCGIAHWGVAMAVLENPFGWPPSSKMLSDGAAAVARARAAGAKSQRELDYIAAIEVFYKDSRQGRASAPGRGLREGDGAAVRAVPERPRGRHLLRARAQRHRRWRPTRPTPSSSRRRRSSRRCSGSSRTTRAPRTT